MRLLGEKLTHYNSNNQNNWSNLVQYIIFACDKTKRHITKMVPHFLLSGCQSNLRLTVGPKIGAKQKTVAKTFADYSGKIKT